jgi:carboxyl-terminal processing protease
MRRPFVFMPIVCGLMLAAGVFLGSFLGEGNSFFSNRNDEKALAFDKIRAVLRYVENNYVDSVDAEKLTDQTLEAMLQHLDPHSDYFTAEQIQAMNEPLQGNFEGVGIEYNFIHDTLVVMAVLPEGPSEKAGIQPGDRFVKADGAPLTGKAANEKFMRSKLRGAAGTKVVVSVKRPGVPGLQDFTCSTKRPAISGSRGSPKKATKNLSRLPIRCCAWA